MAAHPWKVFIRKQSFLIFLAARDVVNSPQNAFVRLPRKIPKAPFFIQVSVLVTLPYITGEYLWLSFLFFSRINLILAFNKFCSFTGTSSDISILSLIGFYCGHCSMYFSFPNVEWQFSDGETLALCSCCAKKGELLFFHSSPSPFFKHFQ